MITQEEIKKQFHYSPLSGEIIRKQHKRYGRKKYVAVRGLDVHGYVQVSLNGKQVKGHRLVWFYMTGSWPEKQIDHINHNMTDNRWANLREVNNIEQHRNRPMQCNNTSGYVGVAVHKKSGRFVAYINTEGKRINLGYFKTAQEAAAARLEANKKHGFHDNHGTTKGRPKYKKYKA